MAQRCVAIVDDEEMVRSALGRLLRLADYEVLGFDSGQAFLDALAARAPDGVLLDLHMPGLSGLQVLAALRARDAAIPVVLISASDDTGLPQRARDGGACAFLRKPFSNLALLDAVRSALGSRPGLPAQGPRRGV